MVQVDTEATVTQDGATIDIEVRAVDAGRRVGADPLENCVASIGRPGAEVMDALGATGVLTGATAIVRSAGPAERFSFVWCYRTPDRPTFVSVWGDDDTTPQEIVELLARSARASIVAPTLVAQSAPDGLETPFLTQLPVWFWVDPSAWRSLSGTASLPPLTVSVSVRATPTLTVWRIGDSSAVRCGRGVVWQPGLEDGESDCALSFTHPGEGELRLTTRYETDVSCAPTALCAAGALKVDPIDVASGRPVRVVEAWGVVVG